LHSLGEKDYNTASQEEFSEADIDMRVIQEITNSNKKSMTKGDQEECLTESAKKKSEKQNNLQKKLNNDKFFESQIGTSLN